jgi:farnesyl-diphosphate synthase (EC 2.5.1.10)
LPTMNNALLGHHWQIYQQRCESTLSNYLTALTVNDAVNQHSLLSEAIAYSCLDGGKRLRASLVYAVADIFDCPLEQADAAAAAVELIHCYSLVHDDMPEMDNDQYRRGKLSTHAKYDAACALLVGDNLQTLAFDILSHDKINTSTDAKNP